jgi:alpha-beta hydrolase superfamily lysophospholipase
VELRYEERITSEWATTETVSAAASSCEEPSTTAAVHVQRTSHWVKTEDGWNLHLLHVSDPAQRSDTQRAHRRPVLLVPGLASSGVHTYDLDPSVSLAQHLALLGWDVWVADLRGGCTALRPGPRVDTRP